MTFMLGAFSSGLVDGAKTATSMYDSYQGAQQRKEQTRALAQQTDFQKQMFDAGKTLAGAGQDQAIPTTQTMATTATPSDSGPTGGGPGTTSNGPVAPTNFDTAVPQPTFMQSVGAGGYDPMHNPEVGSQAAQGSAPGQAPTGQMPMPSPPSLSSDTSRTQPTGLGGSSPYGQSFNGQAPAGATVRPIVTVDPTRSNQAISTNTPATAPAGANVPPAAMPTYDAPEVQSAMPAAPSSPPNGTVRNRPVGAALSDWMHGTNTPDRPLTHGKAAAAKPQQTSSSNIGRHLAGVLNVG